MLASRCSFRSQQLAGRKQVGAATGLRQHGRPCDFSRSSRSQRGALTVCASGVRARWCIDVEYGHKQTVTGLLQEWVADIGSRAGLTPANTRISSGSVGVAESRLELEVCFGSLSEWEQFLASISPKDHKAWSQRVQGMIVGGSPRWELFRAVPAFPDAPDAAAATAAITAPAARPVVPSAALPPAAVSQPLTATATAAASSVSSILAAALGSSGRDSSYGSSADVVVKPAPITNDSSSISEQGSGSLSFIDDATDAEVVLDWKGEPMKVNPGDKLPFKFL